MTCPECGRVFDMTDDVQAEEWYYGHDCEVDDDPQAREDEARIVSTTFEPRHPEVSVRLVGTDGNAFMVMGRVVAALKRAGVDEDERRAFLEEARSADYDHLLLTCLRWVEVE